MRITSKGQVTIPIQIREQLGLLPHTEVEFELAEDHARIRKAQHRRIVGGRGSLVLRALRGTGDVRMTTGEIMALTRGEPQRKRRK
jgi:AbrB family looped-hinge helix DNA binding protein